MSQADDIAALQSLVDGMRAEIEVMRTQRPMRDLTDEDRAALSREWNGISCAFCGGAHPGVCNRVRRVEADETGRARVTEFWSKWEPNPGTIMPVDVWGSPAEMAAALERAAREQRAEAELARVLVEQARAAERESRRQPSPREVIRDVLPRASSQTPDVRTR